MRTRRITFRRSPRRLISMRGHPAHHRLRETVIAGIALTVAFTFFSSYEVTKVSQFASINDLRTKAVLTLNPSTAILKSGQQQTLVVGGVTPGAELGIDLAGPGTIVGEKNLVVPQGAGSIEVRYEAPDGVASPVQATVSVHCIQGCSSAPAGAALTVNPRGEP